jgi:DNA-binding transcriptional regulator YiaG
MATPLDTLADRVRQRRGLPEPRVRRLIRENAGVRRQDIADVLGVNQATVARWEYGTREPHGAIRDAYVVALARLQQAAVDAVA